MLIQIYLAKRTREKVFPVTVIFNSSGEEHLEKSNQGTKM